MKTEIVPPSEWWEIYVKDQEAKRAAGTLEKKPSGWSYELHDYFAEHQHSESIRDDVVKALAEVSR